MKALKKSHFQDKLHKKLPILGPNPYFDSFCSLFIALFALSLSNLAHSCLNLSTQWCPVMSRIWPCMATISWLNLSSLVNSSQFLSIYVSWFLCQFLPQLSCVNSCQYLSILSNSCQFSNILVKIISFSQKKSAHSALISLPLYFLCPTLGMDWICGKKFFFLRSNFVSSVQL